VNEERLLKLFSDILQRLLGDDSIRLHPDTVRADIDGWDSFNYVNFIVAIEQELCVRFQVADVESFKTVGDIADETLRLLED